MIRCFDTERWSGGVSVVVEIVEGSNSECFGGRLHDMIVTSLSPSYFLLWYARSLQIRIYLDLREGKYGCIEK